MKSNFIYHPLSFSSLPEAITQKLKLLDRIKQPVEQLFYTGNLKLLESKAIIAIIGSRSPNPYAKALSAQLASKLAKAGASIISGGAMGIDIIAHQNSLPSTIMISPSSLDQIYPPTNAKTIQEIAKKSLILSEYEKAYNPHKYSFLMRNRIIIALADAIIIPYADLKSGSQNSANVALKLDKKLFTIPHRLGESNATNALLSAKKMEAIYDIDEFITSLGLQEMQNDEILDFCSHMPSFEEASLRFGQKILEYELEGKIVRENGYVRVK